MTGAVLLASLLLPVHSFSQVGNHGYKNSASSLPRVPVVTMLTGEQLMENRALPNNFDWRNVNGQNFVTIDLNQHQPYYCGACWVHGTTSALNDRIKIMRKARFPDVILSRQSLINCIPDPSGEGPPPGCHGGDAYMLHKFMHEHKVPDESCLAYSAVNQECTPLNVCRNCFRQLPLDPLDPFKPGKCWGEPTFIGYGVSNFGQISGEAAMMKEIYARGPIACSFVTTVDFVQNYAKNAGVIKNGVFRDPTVYNESDVDHVMEVTGWGEVADGTKYWVVRNSWGTYWGNAGWFLLERGTNSLLGEQSCDWAVPDFSEVDYDLLNQVQGDYYHGVPGLGGAPNDLEEVVATAEQPVPAVALGDSSLSESAVPPSSLLQSLLCSLVGAFGGAAVVLSVPCFRRSLFTQQPLLG
eukprot:TRINITY_DN3605_c0_g2_i1.p1 TRINITY_DN3605_c0_g2~~TRINITY_DN3605_c0_g2_i1.p1  ORF type:complete len:411 (-),score=72.21 TRINITY_DN3605_c0_g2_i1:228-1460(-)